MEVLNAAMALMRTRRRGMSMFGADNLSPVALSVASNNKFSPNSVSRAKTEPILHRDGNNFESVGSASDFDDIDSWIDENIPEHLRTPNAKSHDFSAASDSHILPVNIDKTSYSGNKVHPRRTSYWTQGNNVVNTSTDEFELLRIRRNVSHLQLHGNYPTSYDEEHCSRTIPEFLLLRDFKEEQAAKDLEREVELAFGGDNGSGLNERILKFHERVHSRNRDSQRSRIAESEKAGINYDV